MMTRAYNEMYLNDSMQTLAEVFSLVKGKEEIDLFIEKFTEVLKNVQLNFNK